MADDLLTFLKLLADPTRLNILGLLANETRSVDELAAILALSPSTISHHLSRLHRADLVAARARQYYHLYALKPETIQQYLAELTPEHLAGRVQTSVTVDDEAYTRQVLARWLHEGRLQELPSQVQHRRIVLTWLVEKFDLDRRYDEEQVWQLLEQWCDLADMTQAYRALIEAKLLARRPDGSWYWRPDSPLAQASDPFEPEQLPVAETPNLAQLRKQRQLDPQLILLRIAIRFRPNRTYSEAEVDDLIQQYSQGEPATVRNALLQAGLLLKNDDGTYWREVIRPPSGPEFS